MIALLQLAACVAPTKPGCSQPGTCTSSAESAHTGCGVTWGCGPRPEPFGVDVRSRRHLHLPGPSPGQPVGRSLAVGRVGGVAVLAAASTSAVTVESFPSDGRWDNYRWGGIEFDVGDAVGVADWAAPILSTDRWGMLYNDPLVPGPWEGPDVGTSSASTLDWPDVDGGYTGRDGDSLAVHDLDGDGVDDVLMAIGYGRVLGLKGAPPPGRDVWAEPMFELYGQYPSSQYFGYRVGEFGDLTGDGVPEMTFAAEDDDVGGRIWIVPLGPFARYTDVHDVGWSLVNDDLSAGAGYSIALGDVTGDGVNDLVAGAPFAGDSAGMVFVYAGPITQDGVLADAVATLRGQGPDDWCGFSVEVLQDQNGDGHDEVVVGCPQRGGERPGRVEVYSGADVMGDLDVDDAALVLHTVNDLDVSPRDSFGWAVQADLDLTGDGLDDLVLSAHAEVRNGVAGGVYVLESPALD